MARANKINFREADANKIKNIVKRVNAKINYNLKKNPEIAPYLPEKESAQQIINALKGGTRNQFNEYVRQANNFLKRGSTKTVNYGGEQIPLFLRKEISVRLKRINTRRNAMLSKIKVGPEYGNINRVERANLRPKKNYKKTKSSNFISFLKSVFKQGDINYIDELNRIYKENFITSMYNHGFTNEEIEIISAYLNTFDINEIYLLSLEDERLHLRFIYSEEIESDENLPSTNMVKAFIEHFGILPSVNYYNFNDDFYS